jgi:hypothetical protein
MEHCNAFTDSPTACAAVSPSQKQLLVWQGDTIAIPYNGEIYYIDIKEVKPDKAVSVVETDVEVDFAPPLDYKEPERPPPPAVPSPLTRSDNGATSASGSAKAAEQEPELPRFTAFSGVLSCFLACAMLVQHSLYCSAVAYPREVFKVQTVQLWVTCTDFMFS